MQMWTIGTIWGCLVLYFFYYRMTMDLVRGFGGFSPNQPIAKVATRSPKPFLRLKGFKGRLGNRMFQYNSLLGIADAANMIPVVEEITQSSIEFGNIFELTPGVITNDVDILNRTYGSAIGEGASGVFAPTLMTKRSNDTLLSGFLQSYKYFDHISHRIRKEMTFRRNIKLQADDSLQRTLRSKLSLGIGQLGLNVTYIGVHARRTDMTNSRHRSLGFNTPNETYYHKAMAYFKNRYPQSVFVVVSDDLDWARKCIQGNRSDAVVLEVQGSPEVDMAILGTCNHSIMSAGTFGWWGAWLAGGETVYYSGHPVPGSRLHRRFNFTDHYPPNWVGIQ